MAARKGSRSLDQALTNCVGDGVGAVSQIEAARDVVDHVLDGAHGQEELTPDLGRVKPLGQQAQDLHLPVGES